MSHTTDKELIVKIEATVDDLNRLLRQAQMAGIQFDASVSKWDVRRLRDTDPVFFIEVFVGGFHRIERLQGSK